MCYNLQNWVSILGFLTFDPHFCHVLIGYHAFTLSVLSFRSVSVFHLFPVVLMFYRQQLFFNLFLSLLYFLYFCVHILEFSIFIISILSFKHILPLDSFCICSSLYRYISILIYFSLLFCICHQVYLPSIVVQTHPVYLLFLVVDQLFFDFKNIWDTTIKGREVSYDPQIFEFLFLIFCITNEISFTIISLSSSDKLFLESGFFIRNYYYITNYHWNLLRFTLYIRS